MNRESRWIVLGRARRLLALSAVVIVLPLFAACSSWHVLDRVKTNRPPSESPADHAANEAFLKQREAARQAARVEREYELADLVASARKRCGENEDDAKQLLAGVLSPSLGYAPLFGGSNESNESDGLRWSGTTLSVRATPDEHVKIAEDIATLRRHGLSRVVTLELRFLTASSHDVESLVGGWTVGDVGTFEGNEGRSSADGLRARMVTEFAQPIRYKVVDTSTAQAILQRIQGDRRANSLGPPKITTFGHLWSRLADCTEKPFVVGIRNATPEVRSASEGTVVRLRPVIQEDDRLRLDCEVTLSTIGDVGAATFKAQDRDAAGVPFGRDVAIQTPSVTRLAIDGSVEMRDGESLLIGGLRELREKDATIQSLMLMITPRILPAASSADAAPSGEWKGRDIKADVHGGA